jgi:flagellar motor protein MotB
MSEDFNKPARWMLSFADLLSVILCFFVLMYSMSIPNQEAKEKYDNNSTNPANLETSNKQKNVTLTKTDINLSTSYLMNVISEKANRDEDLKKLNLSAVGENIVISLTEAEFTTQLAPKIAALLKPISNDIFLFTGNLDKSYDVANTLKQNYMEKDIALIESPKHKGRIDFVIYP